MGTSQSCFFGVERILELVLIILSLMSSVVTDIEEFHFNQVVELISLNQVQSVFLEVGVTVRSYRPSGEPWLNRNFSIFDKNFDFVIANFVSTTPNDLHRITIQEIGNFY